MTDLTLSEAGLSATTLQRHVVRLLEYGRPFDGIYDGRRWAGRLFDFDTKAGVALMLPDGRRSAVKIDDEQALRHEAAELATEAVRELLTWAAPDWFGEWDAVEALNELAA